MKEIAVIEFNGWHSDCIYSQVLFLKAKGYKVHLICNNRLKNLIADIHIADKVMLTDMSLASSLKVWWYLIRNRIKKVVFNTSQGSKVLKFCLLPFPRWIEFYGLIHDLRKLTESNGQRRIMKKVKKYFVLADFLDSNFPDIEGFSHARMSPIFPLKYPKIEIEKSADDIWIVVAGSLDFARRDYMALFQQGAKYSKKVKFILLGDSNYFNGSEVKQMIKENGMEDSFILFDHFLPNGEFYSYASMADYIMLLVHQNDGQYEEYFKYKITGSMLIAYAFRKPMLCDEAFKEIPDYAPHSIFYKREELAQMVNSLEKPDPHKFYNDQFEANYSLDNLSQKYVDFIEQ